MNKTNLRRNIITKIKSNSFVYKRELINHGFLYFAERRIRKTFINIIYLAKKISFFNKSFVYEGYTLHYLIRKYNVTWRNERCVEIPLIWNFVQKLKNAKVLEVGNVLSHYYTSSHDVVDKYEIAKGVINQDIVSYKKRYKYDVIVSISTLEHIGWDEIPKEPQKIHKALNNLKTLLRPGGKLIFTIPLGYNTYFDNEIINKKILLSKTYYMERINKQNIWKETNAKIHETVKYGKPFPFANGILIGVIKNDENLYIS